MRVSVSCELKQMDLYILSYHHQPSHRRKRSCQLLFVEYALGDKTIPAAPRGTQKKIRKGGKATRIAEWRSGSERWGAPAVGPRISLPGPSHLCDDSHPPYRPRPDSEPLLHRSWDIKQADTTGRPTWKLEGGWGPIVDRTQPLASRLPRLPFSVLSIVSQWQ